MLDIYTNSGWLPVIGYKEYYTDYEYDGTQVVSFDLPVDNEFLQYIKNEVMIRNEENLYLIKTVNKRKTQCSITAELYMDDWKSNKPYADTQNDSHFQTKTLSELLEYIKPTGWKIVNSNIRDIRRTPELKDATQYDVLFSLQETFKVVYEIRNIAKEILVIDPEGSVDRGLYITPELNLDSIEWKGTSNKFCTRLYAYGKDNLTFSSINSGKEYVENNDYTNKLICLTWRDDRYTVKENLLEDAKKKVNEMAVPLISYSVTINDLAVVNDEYKFLDFRLYDKVHTIIDETTSILQTIVKYRKYHETPEKNIVTLSSEAQKLTSKIDKISNVLGEDGQKFQGSILQQAQQAATELINSWGTKGHKYETENETFYLDKIPKESAKYCLRVNLGGIAFSQQGWQGPYLTAWTIDGKFNADFITVGTLRAINIEGVNVKGSSITGGTVKGVTGEIGGWKISTDNLSGTVTQTYNFVQADLDKVKNYITKQGTLTDAEKNKYDTDGDGDVTASDYLFIKQVIDKTIPNYSTAKISLKSHDLRQMLVIEIIDGARKGWKTTVGACAAASPSIRSNHLDGDYGSVGLNSVFNDLRGASLNGDEYAGLTSQNTIFLNGTNHVYTNRSIETLSDARKKRAIKDIDISALFDYIKVKEFEYIDGGKKQVGVIAQDFLNTPFEEFVLSKDKTGIYSVDYSVLNMANIQKVQKLEKRVNDLEAKVEALEKRLNEVIK